MKGNLVYYFAYGTLLDIDTARATAPSAHSHGIMRLDGYHLDFAQCARPGATGCTLKKDSNSVTYGVQYEVSDDDMNALNAAAVSGDDMWVHMPIQIVAADGGVTDSVTYVIPGDAPEIAPSDDYVRPILKGLDDLDLPPDYVAKMKAIISSAQARS